MAVSDLAIQINKLISGACAVAYTPIATDAPANISDIITITGATPAIHADWDLFGATKGGASYGMDIGSEELTVDQRSAAVFEDITEITRTFSTEIAEISAEHWTILEQGTQTTIAAGSGTSAQKLVKSGAFSEFDRYRVAFIAQRRLSQGAVTLADATTRGAYVVGGFYSASLSATSSETTFDAGALATRGVEFKAFPDSALSAGEDTMFFFEEQTSTITA